MNSLNDFLTEICAEKGIQIECLSFGYVIRLEKGGAARHIFGAFWDLNSAAADRIACDKAACALLLEKGGVHVIPHELLSHPKRGTESGEKTRTAKFFEKFGGSVVVKPNSGTMGQYIFLCRTMPQAEAAAVTIFRNHNDVAISPYVDFENEYRVFWLDGRPRFAYGKAKGAAWQHNLSRGAEAFEISDGEKIKRLYELAACAAACIGIRFATVDIAELPCGNLAVMEINSGIQAKLLLEQLPNLRPQIKSIYADALELLFMENLDISRHAKFFSP